jgi:hypothetical protein
MMSSTKLELFHEFSFNLKFRTFPRPTEEKPNEKVYEFKYEASAERETRRGKRKVNSLKHNSLGRIFRKDLLS